MRWVRYHFDLVDYIFTQHQSARLKINHDFIYHYPYQVWPLIALCPPIGCYALYLSREITRCANIFEYRARLLTLHLYRIIVFGYIAFVTLVAIVIALTLCTDCHRIFE